MKIINNSKATFSMRFGIVIRPGVNLIEAKSDATSKEVAKALSMYRNHLISEVEENASANIIVPLEPIVAEVLPEVKAEEISLPIISEEILDAKPISEEAVAEETDLEKTVSKNKKNK